MKKVTSIIGVVVLIVFLLGLGIYGLLRNKTTKNIIFYSTGLVPKELFTLSEKINSVSPEPLGQLRLNLLRQMDDLVESSVTGGGFSPKIYSFLKIRLDPLADIILKTEVPQGQIKLWYLYNMGVVAKSDSATVGFDLPNSIVYSDVADFTKKLDVLIYTHLHGDHFDPSVVKTALKNGVSVIVPSGRVSLYQNGNIKIIMRDENGEDILDFLSKRYGLKSANLIAIKPQEKITIKGVGVTGYPASHTYNPDPQTISGVVPEIALSPINWFYVELGGVTLLDTGDSSKLLSQANFVGKKVDVFMAHLDDMRSSDDLVKLVPNAKIILPLHVLELQHGSGIINYMMYKNALEANVGGVWRNSGTTKFVPLLWGESLTVKTQ